MFTTTHQVLHILKMLLLGLVILQTLACSRETWKKYDDCATREDCRYTVSARV